MDDALQILVVIISVTLGVFLVVSIVALIKIIQILNDIKRITAKAEQIADQAKTVGKFFQYSSGSTTIVRLISNIIHSFNSKKIKK